MGRSCILESPPPPPRQGDARGSAEAGLSWQKVQRREANRRCHRLTEPTPKALCLTPPPPPAHTIPASPPPPSSAPPNTHYPCITVSGWQHAARVAFAPHSLWGRAASRLQPSPTAVAVLTVVGWLQQFLDWGAVWTWAQSGALGFALGVALPTALAGLTCWRLLPVCPCPGGRGGGGG